MEEAGLKLVAQGADAFFRDMDRAGRSVDDFASTTDQGAARVGKLGGASDLAGKGLGGLGTIAGGVAGVLAGVLAAGVAAVVGGLIDVGEKASTARTMLQGIDDVDLQGVITDAALLESRYGADFQGVLSATRTLMGEFGLSADEAMSFVVSGYEKGLDASGDFLDTVGEYSNLFAENEFSAAEFFSTLETGQANGVLGTDKIADAWKEFGIRIREDTDANRGALGALGIDAAALYQGMRDGTVSVADANALVLDKLREIKDPIAQNTLGVALFGTQWEDLGASAVLGVDMARSSMEDLATTAEAGRDRIDSLGELGPRIWGSFTSALLPASDALLELVNNVWPAFEDAVAGAAGGVATFVKALTGDRAAFAELPGTMQTIVKAVQGIPGAFEAAQRAVEGFFKTPLGSAIKDAASGLGDYLVNDFGPDVEGALSDGRAALDAFFETPLGREVQEGAQVVADYFANDFVADLTNGVAVVQRALDDFAASPWGQQIQRGAEVVADYFVNDWPGQFQRGVGVVQQALDELGTFLSPWGERIQRGAQVVGDFFANDFPGDFSRGVDLVVGFFDELPGRAQSGLDGLVSAVRNLPTTISSAATEVGAAIINGIAQGIRNGVGTIISAAQGAAAQALAAAKAALGIESPSRRFAEDVGVPISQGIAEGILAATGDVERALGQLGDRMGEQAQRLVEQLNAAFATGVNLTGAFGGSVGGLAGIQEDQFTAEQALRKAEASGDRAAIAAAVRAVQAAQARTNAFFLAGEEAQRAAVQIGGMDPARAATFLGQRTQQLQEIAQLEERIAAAQAAGNVGGAALLARQMGLVRERQSLELKALGVGADATVQQLISGAALALLGQAGGSSMTSYGPTYNYSPTYGGAPPNPSQDFAAMRLLAA